MGLKTKSGAHRAQKEDDMITRIEITDSTGEPILTFDEPSEGEIGEAVKRYIQLYEENDDALAPPAITRTDDDGAVARGRYNPDFKSFAWDY